MAQKDISKLIYSNKNTVSKPPDEALAKLINTEYHVSEVQTVNQKVDLTVTEEQLEKKARRGDKTLSMPPMKECIQDDDFVFKQLQSEVGPQNCVRVYIDKEDNTSLNNCLDGCYIALYGDLGTSEKPSNQ